MSLAITLRRGALLSVALALLACVAACGKTAAQKQQEEAATLTTLGEKYVREKVRDPASGAPCGEVNAKDAFGTYIGFQRYISVARELTLLAQDVAPAEFEESWRELCR
jgi:curli biogenesis system outer membrane secretion channel CsgG